MALPFLHLPAWHHKHRSHPMRPAGAGICIGRAKAGAVKTAMITGKAGLMGPPKGGILSNY